MADEKKGSTMPEFLRTNPGRAPEPAPPLAPHHSPSWGAEQAAEISRQVKQGVERNRLPDAPKTKR